MHEDSDINIVPDNATPAAREARKSPTLAGEAAKLADVYAADLHKARVALNNLMGMVHEAARHVKHLNGVHEALLLLLPEEERERRHKASVAQAEGLAHGG